MPNFTFTGPQGQQITVTGPDGATPEQAFAIMQQHMGGNPAQTKVPGYQASDTGQFIPIQNAGQRAKAPTGNAALGAAYGAVNTLTGGLNAIPKGIAGIAGLMKGAVTPGESADNQSQYYMEAAPQIPQIQSSDSNTQVANQAVTGAASQMAAAIPQGLDTLKTFLAQHSPQIASINPAIESYIRQQGAQQEAKSRLGLNIAGNILPMMLNAGRSPEANPAAALTPKQQMLQMAQQKYGLKIAPGEAGGAPIASGLEDITGAAMAEKLATAKNQPIVNKVGAQEIQQPQMSTFTRNNIQAAKTAPNAEYNKVAAVGDIPTDAQYQQDFSTLHLNPRSKGTIPSQANSQISDLQSRLGNLKSFDAQDGLNEIADLRYAGWKNMKDDDPEQNRLGGAQLRAADAIENQIDRYASSRPEGFDDPNLINKWRAARRLLAKIHTVNGATVGTDLSVGKLVRAYKSGAPLSGGLLDLAQIGEEFPNSLKDASRIRGPRTFTKLSTTFGGAGALGAVALGHPAVAAALGGAVLGTPLLRSTLLSKPVQASLLPRTPIDPIFLRSLMGGAPAALNAQNQNPLLGNQK